MAFADSEFPPKKVAMDSSSLKNLGDARWETHAFIRKGRPTQITAINIELDVDPRLDRVKNAEKIRKIIERKKKYYKRILKDWPVRFVIKSLHPRLPRYLV